MTTPTAPPEPKPTPSRAMPRPSSRTAEWLVLYAASIVGALFLAGLLVEVTGGDWRPVVTALIDGSVRNPGRWGQTLAAAAPMLIVALGTILLELYMPILLVQKRLWVAAVVLGTGFHVGVFALQGIWEFLILPFAYPLFLPPRTGSS